MRACLLLVTFLSLAHFIDTSWVFDAGRRSRYSLEIHPSYNRRHIRVDALLGMPKSMSLSVGDTVDTVHGTRRRRFQEMYQGIPVIDASVQADVDTLGRYEDGAVTGTIILDIEKDIPHRENCTLSKETAVLTALTKAGLPPETVIKHKKIKEHIFIDKKRKAHFVFSVEFSVNTPKGEKQPYSLIDRCDGKVLQHYNKRRSMTFTDNPGSTTGWGIGSTYAWGTGSTQSWTDSIAGIQAVTQGTDLDFTTGENDKPTPKPQSTTTPELGSCSLKVGGIGGNTKTGKYRYGVPPFCLDMKINGDDCYMENQFVKIVNNNQKKDEEKNDVISYKCSKGYKDGINEAYSPALDALYFGTQTFKMLNDWYGYRYNKTTYIGVHYGKELENAFWNGERLCLGDGFMTMFPLTMHDVIAHEAGHSITEFNSNLAYEGQSGSIDESFCDITGATAEAFLKKNDWRMGYEIMKEPTESLRYFKNPNRDGESRNHVEDYTDKDDVHLGSGIFNRAFYLIVTRYQIPIRDAYEAFLTANRLYWTTSSTFNHASCEVVHAAYDLGLDTHRFRAGFKRVGVKSCGIIKFLRFLKPNKKSKKLTVSALKQPLFGIRIGSDVKSITLKTNGSDVPIQITLSKTSSRSRKTLKTGTNQLTHTLPVKKKQLLYVWVATSSDENQTNVRLLATFAK